MFGSYAVAPVAIGVMTLFPVLYTSAYASLCGVSKELLEMCEVYKVPKTERVKKLYAPIALPRFGMEAVSVLSFALKLIVSAEVLAFTYQSLGGLMQEASQAAEMTTMMALTLIVCLLGLLIEVVGIWCLKRLEDKVCG